MPSVAIVGTRGYPSYYGGFETAVRKLAPYLAGNGWEVTVYGRQNAIARNDPDIDHRITSRILRGIETKNFSTLSYGLVSSLDVALRRPDVALVMNVANGYFLPIMRARNIPTLVNVDGIEWEREKWSATAKRVFRTGATCTAKWADNLVFDARAIGEYWRETFGASGTFIPYGGSVPAPLGVPDGLSHRGYVLIVARFVPENTVPEFFSAVPRIARRFPVVIVGSSGYGGEYDDTAKKLSAETSNVRWMGHVSNDELLWALWQHAGVYFHGHSVGGTNPALVQAMAAGAPILARDTVFNREVLGQAGCFVEPEPDKITDSVLRLMEDQVAREQYSCAAATRAKEYYSWDEVNRAYELALWSLVRGSHL